MIEAGLTVTVAGLSVVFALLTLLVWLVNAMSRLCRWIEGPAPVLQVAPGVASTAQDEELVGVVSAAIAAYRARRHRG